MRASPLPASPASGSAGLERSLRFGILGPIVVWGSDETPAAFAAGREARLLAALVVTPGALVWSERLIDAVWGESLPKHPAASLHNVVYRLRRLLDEAGLAERLVERGAGYALDALPGEVDAAVFESLVKADPSDAAPAEVAARLEAALALWRGRALESVTGSSRELVAEAHRLEALRVTTVERKAQAGIRAGRARELIPDLVAYATEWPHREALCGLLMVAFYRTGSQHEALRAYRRASRRLAAEAGVEPGPWLQRVELAILRHDDGGLDDLTDAALSSS